MAFIEFEAQGMDKGTALEIIKAGSREKLKDYECPQFFEVIEKIPHKENGGKQDFLVLEKMARDIAASF